MTRWPSQTHSADGEHRGHVGGSGGVCSVSSGRGTVCGWVCVSVGEGRGTVRGCECGCGEGANANKKAIHDCLNTDKQLS